VLKKNHLDEQFVARRRVRDLPGTIAGMSERLSKLSADAATAKKHATDAIAIGGRAYSRQDIPDILGGQLDGLPKYVQQMTRIPLGTYRGLSFGIVLRPQFPPDVYLEGSAIRQSMFARQYPGPRAVLNELERMANTYTPACHEVRQNLAIAEGQLRDYQASLGKPFIHEVYLSELTSLRDQLKTGLSGAPHGEGKESPSVSELAALIKSIKAAHNLDAAPERVRQKHSSAEEPITARIRRRAELLPVADPATDPDVPTRQTRASDSSEFPTPASFGDPPPVVPADQDSRIHDGSIKRERTFEERVDPARNCVDFDSSGRGRVG